MKKLKTPWTIATLVFLAVGAATLLIAAQVGLCRRICRSAI